jgi:dipeptidyl aminopeptidase/acylaminoacyl peptidase
MSRFKLAPLLIFLPALASSALSAVNDTPRHFEVSDSIAMSDFSVPPLFSPDGRHFVTVTQRGRLPQGDIEATLWLFDTAAVQRAIADKVPAPPAALAQMHAVINTGAGVLGQSGLLMQLKWEEDSAGILFLGRDGHDNRQLFKVRLDDRKPIGLTPASQDVVDFGLAGKRIVYFAGPDASSADFWNSASPSQPDIVVGTGQSLTGLLYPNVGNINRNYPTPFGVWSIEGTVAAPLADPVSRKALGIVGSYNISAMTGSPDGSRLVVIAHADEVPASWGTYDFPKLADTRPFDTHAAKEDPSRDYGRALQYQLIDLQKGQRRPLLDAPLADWQRGGRDNLQSAWSPDGLYVAVSGTYLPLDRRTGKGPLKTCGAAIVDSRKGTVQCVVDRDASHDITVRGLNWESARRLVVQTEKSAPFVIEHRSGRWRLASSHSPQAPSAPPLDLSIRQSLNEPPALFAKDPASTREQKIFDPNPELAGIAMGTVTEIFWTDAHGRSINGGLVKPADFVPGKRYPLVIQTHNFRPRRFFRTGISDTASAGRALAARGMLVLQVDEPGNAYMFTPEEATENGTRVYLAAVDKLASEGLVDPEKVGITGFSRTAYYVSRAITDAPDRFAAAMIANGDAGTLPGYYSYLTDPGSMKEWADFFGGGLPYGEGLKSWIEYSPGFRTDRIRAPVLISAGDPQHLIPLWGLYAPLRDQGKPVELQYIRTGQHNLVKPLQILAHQEMIVDWFDFWLNGHENPHAGKAEQYARWRRMRGQRE